MNKKFDALQLTFVKSNVFFLAAEKLENGAKKKDVEFYKGQLKTAEFFINAILPTTLGKMDSIVKCNGSAVEISEAAFGG